MASISVGGGHAGKKAVDADIPHQLLVVSVLVLGAGVFLKRAVTLANASATA